MDIRRWLAKRRLEKQESRLIGQLNRISEQYFGLKNRYDSLMGKEKYEEVAVMHPKLKLKESEVAEIRRQLKEVRSELAGLRK